MDETEPLVTKQCASCKEEKPLSQFLRRTGRRSSTGSRRGACRACRKVKAAVASVAEPAPVAAVAARENVVKRRSRAQAAKPLLSSPPRPSIPLPNDPAALKTTRQGTIWMRGKTDKGRRWYQEIELELAVTLVKEHAAVIVNRHTIRRLFSNKDFRRYILERDEHTCYFCGQFGDTIDHMLPRAKGGHTTPVNCVCACNACNQSKADQDIESFMK
ncbi:HNH endonuclease [Paenibacillus sp. PL91]|uniref:HNH endonuclease n=1 Tax=Paenibacillus sp. PL91 TaxID=2729538 RepID=UPI00145FB768|nr:HNH endonuclease [Paenibacillus sp. PL91]MBC9201247.1 HNH endonuclease [Paenibacillus sp. PL91]